MTTTIMYSGKEGKNSSKVLAPPGGKSNNIFGFAEETPAQSPVQRKAASQSPFAQDTPPKPQDTPPKPQDSGPAKPFKPVSSFNPVTGEPHSYAQQRQPQQQQASPSPQQQRQSAPPPQQQQQTPPQQQQQASPLPQQAAGANTENKPSVKIYNPPGGRSSIQF